MPEDLGKVVGSTLRASITGSRDGGARFLAGECFSTARCLGAGSLPVPASLAAVSSPLAGDFSSVISPVQMGRLEQRHERRIETVSLIVALPYFS